MNLIREILNRRLNKPVPFTFVSDELKRHWEELGYVLLKDAIDPDLVDRLNNDISTFRKKCGETKDEIGYGQRIGLFHVSNSNSLKAALNLQVRSFLRWVFNADPVLYGSLTFEAGTEQRAHRDNIFFYTEPHHAMAGAWLALEDVQLDAGPLFYIPGSHRWPVIRGEDVRRSFPDMDKKIRELSAASPSRQQLAGEAGGLWSDLLDQEIAERKAAKMPVIAKKGDVFIWHGLLVHGGLPRKDRRLSRRSMVTHFIARNCGFWDNMSYFLLNNAEFSEKNALRHFTIRHRLGEYVPHKKPVIY